MNNLTDYERDLITDAIIFEIQHLRQIRETLDGLSVKSGCASRIEALNVLLKKIAGNDNS